MKLETFAEQMRAAGLRVVCAPETDPLNFTNDDGSRFCKLTRVELSDSPVIPATEDLSLPEDEETKPPGICIHPKCGEKNGWQFARDYCRTHGLAAAGVSGAR